MAVKTGQYASRTTQDASRGPSQSIWFDCPLEDFLQGFGGGIGTAGYLVQDDFLVTGTPTLNAQSSLGQWSCFADTGSTFPDPMLEGGVLDLTNTTSAKQIVLASNAGGFGFISPATNFPLRQKMWFECSVSVDQIASGKRDFFIGLCDQTSSQITSANNLVVATAGNTLITTKGLFGFHFRNTTNPSDVGVAYNVAGGTVQYPGGATNLQKLSLNYGPAGGQALTVFASTNGKANANTFIKLGWVFDPNAPTLNVATAVGSQTAGATGIKPLIQFFVNGQLVPVFLASTEVQASTFPSNYMTPVIVFSAQSTSPNGYIDWIRCAQLASF